MHFRPLFSLPQITWVMAWIAAMMAGLLLKATPLAAAPYPEKTIKLIVPSPAGTAPDAVARLLGKAMSDLLGQAVITENLPGAIGTIGLSALARAAPDGYTLGIQSMPYIVAPSLLTPMPYDTEKDLLPIAQVAWNYGLVVVPAMSPWRSMSELVAQAKAKPGALKFASSGNATPSHLAFALLQNRVGLSMLHIPYKGAGPATMALLAGDVDVAVCTVQSCGAQINAGRLRALATSAPKRLAAYPDLLTLAELGYAKVEIADWLGIVAPAGTPADVVAKLRAALTHIAAMPEFRQRLDAMGMETTSGAADSFGPLIRAELQKWKAVVRDAQITLD